MSPYFKTMFIIGLAILVVTAIQETQDKEDHDFIAQWAAGFLLIVGAILIAVIDAATANAIANA